MPLLCQSSNCRLAVIFNSNFNKMNRKKIYALALGLSALSGSTWASDDDMKEDSTDIDDPFCVELDQETGGFLGSNQYYFNRRTYPKPRRDNNYFRKKKNPSSLSREKIGIGLGIGVVAVAGLTAVALALPKNKDKEERKYL